MMEKREALKSVGEAVLCEGWRTDMLLTERLRGEVLEDLEDMALVRCSGCSMVAVESLTLRLAVRDCMPVVTVIVVDAVDA
jgi:hypothetical protein